MYAHNYNLYFINFIVCPFSKLMIRTLVQSVKLVIKLKKYEEVLFSVCVNERYVAQQLS